MPFISTGPLHTLFIDPDNHVWVYGDNLHGQLGTGDRINREIPVRIPYDKDIKSVATGDMFSLVLGTDGQVWGFGRNQHGQIGLQGPPTILSPQPVSPLSNFVEISAGKDHSLLLDSNGIVWPLGNNGWGQLGLASGKKSITNIPKITSISAGDGYSLLADINGHVWSVGYNARRQLGLDDTITTPAMIENLEGIVKVSAGKSHSLALDNQGRVWGFGNNSAHELGSIPTNDDKQVHIPTIIPGLPPIKDIAVGLRYSLTLDHEGRVWGFGMNSSYQLSTGISGTKPAIIPGLPLIDSLAPGESKTAVVDIEGNLWTFGNSWFIGLEGIMAQRKPAMIPDVQVKTTITEISPFIKTTYPIIKYFMDQGRVTEFRTRGLVDEENSLLEFDLDDDTFYVAVAHYDAEMDKVLEPSYSDEEKFYIFLEDLIGRNMLQNYELRPDIYQDKKGNQGFVFLYENEFYLIRVYPDKAGNIHQPL